MPATYPPVAEVGQWRAAAHRKHRGASAETRFVVEINPVEVDECRYNA